MKKRSHLLSFCGGVITALLVVCCVITALAASGVVSFSTVGLKLNGKSVFAKGDMVQTDAGKSIPSSILYTDDTGGGTTYLPMRSIADLLDVPITWDSTTNTVLLGQDAAGTTVTAVTPGQAYSDLSALPLDCAGKEAEPFTEVTPMKRDSGINLLEEAEYRSGSDFSTDLPFIGDNGRYVSVTVTNNGKNTLLFRLGHQYALGENMLATQIPAGKTVTRTFEVSKTGTAVQPRFAVDISTGGADNQKVDINICAVQFSK